MLKLVVILLVLSAGSLFVGVADLSLTKLLEGDQAAWELLVISRIPRLLAIWLAGAGLSIAGLIMQQISQNRFAAPSTSGTFECALLGYLLSILIFGHGENLFIIFGTAMAGTLIFVRFINSIQFKNAIYVPLVGIIFGNVVYSAAVFIAYKYNLVQSLSTWAVANFSTVLQGSYELLYIAIPVSAFSYWYAARLSAAGMGKDFATNIGLNYQQVVVIGVLLVSVTSASIVMIVGELPFLGLIVPNIVAAYMGDNIRRNIPYAALCGAILVLVCDVLGRVIIFPFEVPIAMIISILGGLVFLYLILREKNNA
ncbi:ABC transporter permease [Vibrio nigripulchritudo]|uniref:Putative ABC transporter involved in vitamin B12 uptake, BtuC n=1 Tax=Vibrio nigripulchritudo TaxID=28173 RepID=U4K5T6_9VIBR|nr:iron chelate uptake ABC transporter family permease subunit [Vibrio nigripulchritudo]KJY67941.1 iron ABC transporter [Vibrio nigripulchritudo]CCO60667.1 putative ABC transporter involved in vitamin B12 uptake, BtuC [Vibrio nigripulchritudo]